MGDQGLTDGCVDMNWGGASFSSRFIRDQLIIISRVL